MPSRSKSQQQFFGLVHALQKGNIDADSVSPAIKQAASSMSSKDVEDFASTPHKNLPNKVKKEMVSMLKEISKQLRESMLNEEVASKTNPIAKTFNVNGIFDDYIKRFAGLQLKPKELEAVNSLKEIKPTKSTPFEIKYDTTDEFGSNSSVVIKKLRENTKFVFTAFRKYTPKEAEQNVDAENPTETKEKIEVNKSLPFEDEISGAAILSDFLKKLDI